MGYWGYYPPYVSVAERRRKALNHAKKLKNCEPVTLTGTKIASSWWGKSWNENLERYADYSNRIGRGRSYVRNGMVLDLKIEKAGITAIVAGSGATPYTVKISIKALSASMWNKIVDNASEKIDSLEALLAGAFPVELKELFFAKDSGLFPTPSEIHFSCSCPDIASMCKHVAAALYGVGARLDASPSLFFNLRDVCVDDLIGKVALKGTEKLLRKEKTKSSRIITTTSDDSKNIEALFGISMAKDESADKLADKRVKSKKHPVKRTVIKKKRVIKTDGKQGLQPRTKQNPHGINRVPGKKSSSKKKKRS